MGGECRMEDGKWKMEKGGNAECGVRNEERRKHESTRMNARMDTDKEREEKRTRAKAPRCKGRRGGGK
jgi:hypothetical protein